MIVCQKCGRKFKRKEDLELLVEIQVAADDIHVGIAKEYDLFDILDDDNAKLFSGCPDCLTDEYLREQKSRYKRKYRKGGHILSLDELAQQDLVYWHDKIEPRGWFMSWQLSMAARCIGPNGCIYYAIKNDA